MEVSKRGKTPGSGKKKGTKNKATLERERLAAEALIDSMSRDNVEIDPEVAANAIRASKAGTLELGRTILSRFANVLAGMAAAYQPAPPGMANKANSDEIKFRQYAELAIYAAEKVAQYESPKLAAVMVGQAQTKKIIVEGGLPGAEDRTIPLPPDLDEDSMKVVSPPVALLKAAE